MEISNIIIKMLELIDRPGFIVQNSMILYTNQACTNLNIQPDSSVAELLCDNYTPNSPGTQSLNLTLLGCRYTATVENIAGYDLFVLEQDAGLNELRVLALASQQLRTPLTCLMNSVDEPDPAVNRSIYQLHRAVCNMSDAYRYQIFREPILEPTEIRGFMEELINSVLEHIKSLDVTLQYQGLNTECFCLIDRELLERCVLNLITNSIAAESTNIQISFHRTQTQLFLTVEDNGRGVADHMHHGMFQYFHRDPNLTTEAGLGLGMQMVQAAAHTHNGTVLMEDRDTGGTRITVTLSVMKSSPPVCAPRLRFDYLGGRDHILTEFSDILPVSSY